MNQILISQDRTEPQSHRSAEIKVLPPGLRITKKASESRRDQKSDAEKNSHQHGCRSDQPSRVNVQPNADVKPAVETDQKICLKPAMTKTLQSKFGLDRILDCGLDPGSISGEMGSITPDLEPESLSELRIESPSELDAEVPHEPAVAENLQPKSSITQAANLGCEKESTGTTVLPPIIKSNEMAGSGSNFSLTLTQENQEPKTVSKQRPGPFTLSEQNLTPDPGSGFRSNPETFLQPSKTLTSGSFLGDKRPKSESNQYKIGNVKSGAGDCKTILLQSGFTLNLLSDTAAKDTGDSRPGTRLGEQRDVQTEFDPKSPGSQPNSETTSNLTINFKPGETKTSKTRPCKAAFQSESGETSNEHLSSDLISETEAGLRIETPPDSRSTLTEDQKSLVNTKNIQPDPKYNSKEFRNMLSELGSNQIHNQPGIDPPPRPKPHEGERPAPRPKEASPVDTRIFQAQPECKVRISGDHSAGRIGPKSSTWSL